jgi:hypothetical protein
MRRAVELLEHFMVFLSVDEGIPITGSQVWERAMA